MLGNKCELRSMPSSMLSFVVLPTQKERVSYCRTRTKFTKHQIDRLEENFEKKKYIDGAERFLLAKDLGLSVITIKTWYQNKRMKWKKELQEIDPSCQPTKPKGRPPKCASHNIEDHIIVD